MMNERTRLAELIVGRVFYFPVYAGNLTRSGKSGAPRPRLEYLLSLYGDPAGQNSFLWFCLYSPVYELVINPARENQLRFTA
jgi:hypothetical protein